MLCHRTKNKRLPCQLGFSRRMRKWDTQKCLLLIQAQYLITWARRRTRRLLPFRVFKLPSQCTSRKDSRGLPSSQAHSLILLHNPLQALIHPLDSLSPTNPLMIHHRTLLARRANTSRPLHHKE